jgi:hypothetical protein
MQCWRAGGDPAGDRNTSADPLRPIHERWVTSMWPSRTFDTVGADDLELVRRRDQHQRPAEVPIDVNLVPSVSADVVAGTDRRLESAAGDVSAAFWRDGFRRLGGRQATLTVVPKSVGSRGAMIHSGFFLLTDSTALLVTLVER